MQIRIHHAFRNQAVQTGNEKKSFWRHPKTNFDFSFVVAEIRHECGREKKSDVFSGIQFDCCDVRTLVIVSIDRTDQRRTRTWKSS